MNTKNIYQTVKEALGIAIENDENTHLNELQIVIDAQDLIRAVEMFIKQKVCHLSTITGLYQNDQLVLLYHFWKGEGLTLRIFLQDEKEQIDSLTGILPGAEFYEREIAEMFGVQFNGLICTKKMFLPDNWQGAPPLRIDNNTNENMKDTSAER